MNSPKNSGVIASRFEFIQPPDLPGVTVAVIDRSNETVRMVHEAYASSIVKEGSRNWECNGKHYTSKPGVLAAWEPGDFHQCLGCSPTTQRGMLIAPPLMHQVAGEMGFGPEQLHVRVRQAEDAAVFKAHDRFYRSLERPATALERQTLFANAVRGLLASSFGLRTKKLPGADGADAVDRARSYIESHFARNVGLEELATVAGMSRFQLLRAFKAKVGCGPHAFLIDRKLARARELLAQGQTPADTAAEVGFSDQSHLTRHFKRFFGATPARYQGRT